MYINIRYSRVLWTKKHANLLSFGASFVKKSILVGLGVKRHANNLLGFGADS